MSESFPAVPIFSFEAANFASKHLKFNFGQPEKAEASRTPSLPAAAPTGSRTTWTNQSLSEKSRREPVKKSYDWNIPGSLRASQNFWSLQKSSSPRAKVVVPVSEISQYNNLFEDRWLFVTLSPEMKTFFESFRAILLRIAKRLEFSLTKHVFSDSPDFVAPWERKEFQEKYLAARVAEIRENYDSERMPLFETATYALPLLDFLSFRSLPVEKREFVYFILLKAFDVHRATFRAIEKSKQKREKESVEKREKESAEKREKESAEKREKEIELEKANAENDLLRPFLFGDLVEEN